MGARRDHGARPLVPPASKRLSKKRSIWNGPSRGWSRCRSCSRGCSIRCATGLEQRDRGAVALHVTLTLVDKQQHERSLQLPAPMRDARVLRTLALLDLESNPPPAAIDRVAWEWK
jgi:hypothetical protein